MKFKKGDTVICTDHQGKQYLGVFQGRHELDSLYHEVSIFVVWHESESKASTWTAGRIKRYKEPNELLKDIL